MRERERESERYGQREGRDNFIKIKVSKSQSNLIGEIWSRFDEVGP